MMLTAPLPGSRKVSEQVAAAEGDMFMAMMAQHQQTKAGA